MILPQKKFFFFFTFQKTIYATHLSKLNTEGRFIHNGKLFSKIDGVVMDISLGPTTLVNWFLEMVTGTLTF